MELSLEILRNEDKGQRNTGGGESGLRAGQWFPEGPPAGGVEADSWGDRLSPELLWEPRRQGMRL